MYYNVILTIDFILKVINLKYQAHEPREKVLDANLMFPSHVSTWIILQFISRK